MSCSRYQTHKEHIRGAVFSETKECKIQSQEGVHPEHGVKSPTVSDEGFGNEESQDVANAEGADALT